MARVVNPPYGDRDGGADRAGDRRLRAARLVAGEGPARARRARGRPAPRRATRAAPWCWRAPSRGAPSSTGISPTPSSSSGPSASTRSTPSCTWRRRRSSGPRTARPARRTRRTCAARGTSWRPAASTRCSGSSSPRPTRPTDPSEVLPYTEDMALLADASVRRLEGGGRPDLALVLVRIRRAGRDDAFRQPLRRGRPERLAARSRGRVRGARRPRAGRAIGRFAPARLPLRRGCGRGLPRDLRRARCRARARPGLQRRRGHSRTTSSRSCGCSARWRSADVEPDVRGTGTPEGEIDRQWLDSSLLRELTGWEPRVGLRGRAAPDARVVPLAPGVRRGLIRRR